MDCPSSQTVSYSLHSLATHREELVKAGRRTVGLLGKVRGIIMYYSGAVHVANLIPLPTICDL